MSIFLSSNVIVFFLIESILLLLSCLSFLKSIKILRYWDFNSTTNLQYSLEKLNYLVSTIIFFIVFIKIFLFIYFAQTVDRLSDIVPGAMCGTGVINANDYGVLLLLLKIFIVFGLSIWLIVNRLDIKKVVYPYIKIKYILYSVVFLLICFEYYLDIKYFMNISLLKPTLCCSVVFSTSDGLLLGLDIKSIVVIFYLLYVLISISSIIKNAFLSFMASFLFLFISYYSVVYFFGTYIYELPTHHCPFCMLQKEYHYVGYFIWISLFFSVFFGIISWMLKWMISEKTDIFYKYTMIFSTIFVALCSYFVISYYLKNGVFL